MSLAQVGLWTAMLALACQSGGVLAGSASRLPSRTAVPAAPFAAPGPFQPRDTLPMPDITGSIGTEASGLVSALAGTPPAGLALPDLGIAPPDLPLPATLPGAPEDALKSVPKDALTDALKDALVRLVAPREGASEPMGRRLADRDAIALAYQAHGNAPFWLDGPRFSPAARSALSRIDRATEDGLSIHDFAVPTLRDPTPAQLAAADVALSEAVVAYARQAGGSRVDPMQINRLITATRTIAAVPDILASVSGAADPGATLQGFNPPQPGYAALRAKLAELRQAAPVARTGIPTGPILKLGMRDARVPLVRSRFGLGAAAANPASDDLVYDTRVAAAVAEFQRQNGLPVSGALTTRTVAALSGGDPDRLEGEIISNMERWRWVPRDLGADNIVVNVPDFTLDVTQAGAVAHHARVVVGKPDHQTPIFSDAMRFIIVNPYWNVPLSIIKKEMMPKLAADPNYFANHGYETVWRDGQTYVRQPPGDDNALGRIKFMFPNQHAVYLHDTNARALFGKDKRAFSHGCVRVDQPFKLAAVLLGADRGWSEARVRAMIGGTERTVNLPQPLPIHIVYFTAFVDAKGALQLRDDVYGYSEKVRIALGL